MSTSTWTGAASSDWNDANNWRPAGIPGVDSDVVIASGDAVASAPIGTVNSITDSSDLTFESARTNAVTTILNNTGSLNVDDHSGKGGTILKIGGALINGGSVTIGNTSLSASDKVRASSLDNTGSIALAGSSAHQALLDVTAGSAGFGARGVLSGTVQLDGESAIEFKSGQITSLAANAQLQVNGSDAFIEDSKALGSNSALKGLASIGAGATFDLENGASVSTTGALVNDAFLFLDAATFGDGGSIVNVGGTLANGNYLAIGTSSLSASDEVTAASLDNTGVIRLIGSSSTANQALLDVTGSAGFGAAGVLSSNVQLNNDSAIEFASGQITSLAAGAYLELYGNDAFIEDSTAPGSNSALTGLADIAGTLDLEEQASVSATGALTNTGTLEMGFLSKLTARKLSNSGTINLHGQTGGSTLSIAGALTNTGTLDIGASGLFASEFVTSKSFVNSGTVGLEGSTQLGKGRGIAALNVSGMTTNNGSISINTDTETLAGAVDGKGSFSLYAVNLLFDSSVSAGQTIVETGKDKIRLKQAQSFAATISGFAAGDTIDAANFLAPPATKFNFVENSGGTGGTLTLTDGSLTANILMMGKYSKSDFTLAPDSGSGTLVKFV
jgi:hypothetical protein